MGELDLATARDLRDTLHALPRDTRGVVIDLAELSFMDASGLHALEDYAGAMNGSAPLVLENVPAHVRRLFAVTGADQNPAIELRQGGGDG